VAVGAGCEFGDAGCCGMTKRNAVLLALSSLLVGLLAGAWVTYRFGLAFIQTTYESRQIADATTRISVLKALQAADVERATRQLESYLDGDVIGMSGILDETMEPKKLRETLTMVARYRQGTQYMSSEPTVASLVSNALKPFYKPTP